MDRLKAGWLTKLIGDIAVRVYFELDSIGALVMLFSRRDGGLRVSVVGEPDLANECPAVL